MKVSNTEKEPLWLSEKEFLESFRYAPRVAINLLVKDSDGRVLLTKRNIPPFKRKWHFPGALLLKNEKISDCQKRIANKELGTRLEEGEKLVLIGVFENLDKDPRGHLIDLLYDVMISNESRIKPTIESSETRFFDKLPKDMGFNHQETLVKLGYQTEE